MAVLRRSDLGKAVAYVLSHWEGLILFLEDPLVPLDSNRAEQALRRIVVGRKNHCGSRSQRGAHVSALFDSLVGTAKLCGLAPERHLRQALEAAGANPAPSSCPSSAQLRAADRPAASTLDSPTGRARS